MAISLTPPECLLYDRLAEESVRLGRKLTKSEFLAVAGPLFKAEREKGTKERKRAGIDPRAKDIFNVYPRREGGEASLMAISKALEKDGFEVVLEKTSEYAQAVARWPHNRKKSPSGSSLIPLPSTWFSQRRYVLDNPDSWWEGTGGRHKAHAPDSAAPVVTKIPQVLLDQESAELQARYLEMPEPEEGTLEHALWSEARRSKPQTEIPA
jgi:hypothetical protein